MESLHSATRRRSENLDQNFSHYEADKEISIIPPANRHRPRVKRARNGSVSIGVVKTAQNGPCPPSPVSTNSIVPMLALLLLPQLVLTGIGEAFHFPGQVSLYYQEFPASLSSTATAMVAMIIGTFST
ncbi:hypothetical protein CRYUN_Cryun25bG0070000 [Craigia yunnanensis]